MLWDLTKRIEVIEDGGARVTFICNRATVLEMKEARELRLKGQRLILQASQDAFTTPDLVEGAEKAMQLCHDAMVALLRPMIRGMEVAKNGSAPEAVDDWEHVLDDTDLLYEHEAVLNDRLFFRSGRFAAPVDEGHPGPGTRSPDEEAGAVGEPGEEDQGLSNDVPSENVA